ncbi:MAG TPA: two-component regulator propeller domain-containing protein, partial [Niastella sp.]
MLLFVKSVTRKLVLLPVCIVFVVLLQAQQPTPYHFAHLDFNQGLSGNQINCIYKGRKGFMWFGTMSGLNRFDGYTIRSFRHSIHDTTSLADDYISKIAAGPFNKLWIETRIGFNIYDPATEKFERAFDKYLQKLGMPGYGLTDIVPFDKGFLFVYRDQGIFYFEENKPVIAIISN